MLDLQLRLVQFDLIEDDAARDQLQRVVIEFERFDGNHALAGHVHRHVAELHAEEQIAAEGADRQLAIQILLRLADDVAAEPVFEPGRLRDDQRNRHDADEEGAGNGDHLQKPA